MRTWRDYSNILRDEGLSEPLVELQLTSATVTLHRRGSDLAFMTTDANGMVLHEGSASVVGTVVSPSKRVIGGLIDAKTEVDVPEATSVSRTDSGWLALVERRKPVTVNAFTRSGTAQVRVWPPVPDAPHFRVSPIAWFRKLFRLPRQETTYRRRL